MGLSLFSSSSYDKKSVSVFSKWKDDKPNFVNYTQENLPNPKPNNYKILKNEQIDKFLVVKIKYLDCTNYEGDKILVFENCTLEKLKKQKLIDPHFSENKAFYSPIARFEPTDKGWEMAIKLCKI